MRQPLCPHELHAAACWRAGQAAIRCAARRRTDAYDILHIFIVSILSRQPQWRRELRLQIDQAQ